MRIFFFANDPAQEYRADASLDKRLGAVGFNTGNQLFTQAVVRQLRFEKAGFGFYFDPAYVRENFDIIVVPAANWLNSHEDFGDHADRLEKTGLPLAVIGLGAQSRTATDIPQLKPGTRRLLELFKNRTRSIGVRGEFTQRVLAFYGVENSHVIGCPSTFWNLRATTRLRREIPLDSAPRIAFNGTRYHIQPLIFAADSPPERLRQHRAISYGSIENFETEMALYRAAYSTGSDYIYQSERHELALLLDADGPGLADFEKAHLLQLYGAPDWPSLEAYLRSRGRVFFYPDQWVEHMARYDFALGTRLHGCMAALIAGTPACLIAHDTRTREISAFLGIPCMDTSRFLALNGDWEAVYRETDAANFEDTYRRRFLNYLDFLDWNELPNLLEHPAEPRRKTNKPAVTFHSLGMRIHALERQSKNLRSRIAKLETMLAAPSSCANAVGPRIP